MPIDPLTRFVETSEGGRLAYQVIGDGNRGHVVLYQELSMHLDLFWTDDSVVEITESLVRAGLTCIFFQERGVGLSDPVERKATVDEQAADLLAVLDAEQVRRATLMGSITTCVAVALAAAQQPERVHGLVLLAPMIAGPLACNGEYGWTAERSREFPESYRRSGGARWGTGESLRAFDPGLCTTYNLRLTGMAERCSASTETQEAWVQYAERSDGRSIYPQVRAPTHVLSAGLPSVPREAVRAVAEAIPGAEYHEFAGAQLGDSIGETWRAFFAHLGEVALGAGTQIGGSDRVLATVLFTDIVGSTDQLARLGDAGWRQILEAHDQVLRRNVASAGGRYVNSTGDGALCEFASPAAAVECGSKLCASASELGIEIRVGVHTGECERRGGDLAGMAVHVGARVCGAAGPSEVLVSRTVRELVVGSGLGFVSRGERELKGVPGSWELYAAGRDVVGEAPASAPASPRVGDRLVMEAARRAPGAVRAVNRLGNAAQRRRFARRG